MKAAHRTTLIGTMSLCAISATTAFAEPTWVPTERHCQLPTYIADYMSVFYWHNPPHTRREESELIAIMDIRKDMVEGRPMKASNVAKLTHYNQLSLKSVCSRLRKKS